MTAKLMLAAMLAASSAAALDLSNASVSVPAMPSARERKAVSMLIEEVDKRSQIHWPISSEKRTPSVAISRGSGPAEGYTVRIRQGNVEIQGNDERGILFGIGYLLRQLRSSRGAVSVPDSIGIVTSPKYRLRGHQLGYRPKTNSYDAWNVQQWEQYIRDLAIFGANAIELIPPRSDDDADSPHFPLPPMRMMTEMSRIADEYGLDVWIWYPAMDRDYSNAATVEFALKEWGDVFRKLPRIDAVFVPGGDPGHTQPKYLMALLEKQTQVLHRSHPKAQMWVSPQSFNKDWFNEFIDILVKQQPAWLTGIVHGPQVRVSLPKLRELTPKRYPIRNYPDITHSLRAQFPVPDWDIAYAVTESREVINPRPTNEAAIFRYSQPHTVGFLTYSEGCNDDVNKFIWSGLGWNPDAQPIDILRDYSRYFISSDLAEGFAQGLMALERNWQGPLETNENVYSTLAQFQALDHSARPLDHRNWRFQQAQYRAHYDAYLRSRLIYEHGLEDRALDILRESGKRGSLASMNQAESILAKSTSERVAANWRARVFELAEALFQSIGMQLSVPFYKAIAVDRGASLDTIDVPLNNRRWLEESFAEIRKLTDEKQRLAAIDAIVNWTNPGPGGFYDDLGNPLANRHLVRGLPYANDPAFLESPLTAFGYRGPGRLNWWRHAESRDDTPLEMRYTDLDPNSTYKLRIVYTGDSGKKQIRLTIKDGIEIHPYFDRPIPFRPAEFAIPAAAVKSGTLHLQFHRELGAGGAGRGPQVSEVWLIKTAQ